ncbi:MAG TPA: hypothetical protein VLD36_01020 [Burkholderiales bacterium]|jgi:hypothetical protein|nr:hypothetical protein [Burkholderiales bacterium]
MRNDHIFYSRVSGAQPEPEEIARHMARARRMRSEAVHGYLARAVAWIRGALRSTRAPNGPVGQCC